MMLNEKNNYIPVLNNIYPEVLNKAKLLIVNYPNNPTGAVATLDFYNKLVKLGSDNNIVIANDGAYMEYYGNNNSRISILQAEDAIKNCVEFGTLSKSYNMTGWRIGYIAGNREVIEKLMIVKTNFDSGQFAAIQNAGITALKNGDDFIDVMRSEYNFRRSMVIDTLINKGIHVYRSEGAFYVWFRVPKGYTSQEFTAFLLEKAGIIITPGDTFGTNGEGYCRISLTVNKSEIEAAMKRIETLDI
jgi:LL-diaminopimelate aminotransferase